MYWLGTSKLTFVLLGDRARKLHIDRIQIVVWIAWSLPHKGLVRNMIGGDCIADPCVSPALRIGVILIYVQDIDYLAL